jgi:transcriptional regulator with XRE-family HTH domain
MVQELARECRIARAAASLSQAMVGRALGVSRERISRFERGDDVDPGFLFLVRLFAVLGMSLTARAWPDGSPRRDAVHGYLLSAFANVLHPELGWRIEVPLPASRDRRAWDAMITIGQTRIGVEAETQLRDGQALQRRLNLKMRDGGVDHLLLVVSDTRSNRAFLRWWAAEVRGDLPGGSTELLDALRAGRDPGKSGIVLLKVGRTTG